MTNALPRVIAIVPAAGIGSRAGTDSEGTAGANATGLPKQYRLLKGQPMLRWAVQALLADSRIHQVRVAVAAHDTWAASALAGLPRTVWRPCGGPSRAQTVLAALKDADLRADDWALVHDAARPGLPAHALARLVDQCLLQGSDGGLLALPVADTVKRATPDNCPVSGGARVQASVSRDGLWLAQTPQMFPAVRLVQALQAAGAADAALTDEASAMERVGVQPALVPGSVRNFKVTWPEDFGLMEHWLEEA